MLDPDQTAKYSLLSLLLKLIRDHNGPATRLHFNVGTEKTVARILNARLTFYHRADLVKEGLSEEQAEDPTADISPGELAGSKLLGLVIAFDSDCGTHIN